MIGKINAIQILDKKNQQNSDFPFQYMFIKVKAWLFIS